MNNSLNCITTQNKNRLLQKMNLNKKDDNCKLYFDLVSSHTTLHPIKPIIFTPYSLHSTLNHLMCNMHQLFFPPSDLKRAPSHQRIRQFLQFHQKISTSTRLLHEKMIGKEYSFGAMKLFRKSSNEESAEVQSDFFCSELIAKAYKGLGILDKKKASNSYWPVDFTDRGGLVLEGEGYFGFEKLIILKRHLKLFQ